MWCQIDESDGPGLVGDPSAGPQRTWPESKMYILDKQTESVCESASNMKKGVKCYKVLPPYIAFH